MPHDMMILAASVLAGLSGASGVLAETHHPRAVSDGLDIHYEVHGDLVPGVTPVLLLHGGMGSVEADFAELLPELARDHVVIGIDQQGHGRTGGRDAPVSLASMREDTLAVLDALDVDEVHVVGFSMGGMLAIELGVRAPERLATLTALSASQNAQGMRPEITAMNTDPDYVPSPEIAALLPSEDDFAEMQAAFAGNPSGPEQFDRTMQALMAFIISDWGWTDAELASIGTPALLAIGDVDFMPVEHAALMAEAMLDAQLAVLPDTTHMTILKRPAWLGAIIRHRIATASNPVGGG